MRKRDVNTIIREIRENKAKKIEIANEICMGIAKLCGEMRILTIINPSLSTEKIVERVYSNKQKAIEAKKTLFADLDTRYAGCISRPTREFVIESINSGIVVDDMSPLMFEIVVNVVRCDDDGDFDNYHLYPVDVNTCMDELKELLGDHPSFSISVDKKHPRQENEEIIKEIKMLID